MLDPPPPLLHHTTIIIMLDPLPLLHHTTVIPSLDPLASLHHTTIMARMNPLPSLFILSNVLFSLGLNKKLVFPQPEVLSPCVTPENIPSALFLQVRLVVNQFGWSNLLIENPLV